MSETKIYHFLVEDGELAEETIEVFRFTSGLEITPGELRKKIAGDRLTVLARQHMGRTHATFADSLRIVLRGSPELERAYFGVRGREA